MSPSVLFIVAIDGLILSSTSHTQAQRGHLG